MTSLFSLERILREAFLEYSSVIYSWEPAAKANPASRSSPARRCFYPGKREAWLIPAFQGLAEPAPAWSFLPPTCCRASCTLLSSSPHPMSPLLVRSHTALCFRLPSPHPPGPWAQQGGSRWQLHSAQPKPCARSLVSPVRWTNGECPCLTSGVARRWALLRRVAVSLKLR